MKETNFLNLFTLVILFSFLSPNLGCSQSNACGDLLKIHSTPPPLLEFIDCKEGAGQTLYEATYRVEGQYADSVEAYLVKHYKMSPLTFVCCGWEPKRNGTGQFKITPDDTYYQITMYAEAVDEDDELTTDRSKIKYFYVVATILNI